MQPFQTIRTEGGLFPPDFLQRLSQQQGVAGLETSAYHLDEGDRLRDAINRSWTRLSNAWAAFQAQRARQRPDDPGTTLTRGRWLLVVFQELGYGHLQGAKAIDVDGKTFPVSHAWQRTPIHLLGYGTDLDKRSPGQAGAARSSPHGLVQELLNRHGDHLWGFVSNGLRLRVLRDNATLTRLAFVEFDLEAMMEGGHVSDFAVFWLLCHQSRLEGERPEDCWLETWAREAREQGQRALEQLRDGVERAITALGAGFIAHPANGVLRDALRAGALGTQDYYRQLLRLVYRLIFLFVAEDRDLLLPRDAAATAREGYARFYGTTRLRRMAARRRGTPHPDLYEGLRVVMDALGRDEGCPALGLRPLGSFLWSPRAVKDIGACQLANRDLLAAIRALTVVERGRVNSIVDWRNLGSEELGSVYESLLELHPRIDLDAGTFALAGASGSERKTTGSYYTPESLIQCLLDTALDPVLEEAARNPDAERAILSLKVCDPACGSGHFLVAAAHRIAKRLAAVRTGDEEASPEAVQTALRDVVGHCLHGVDLNEMAVELCKVSLWMEAIEPGKPLSFLDHRILCGNSLLGTTPKLMDEGIPDAAFEALEGDDKDVVRILKARNKKERTGQTALPLVAEGPAKPFGALADSWARVEEIADASIAGLRKKEAAYERLLQSEDYQRERLAADAWCAAFVMPKVGKAEHVVTEDVFRRLQSAPRDVSERTKRAIAEMAANYRFLHWHLAFPDVFRVPKRVGERPENEDTGWSGGFDVVLGNPPWETLEFKEAEWFAQTHPKIASASNSAKRKALISSLKETEAATYQSYLNALRASEGVRGFYRLSGRYPLCGVGKINTYAVFSETNRTIVSPVGRFGCVLPAGIATDDTTKRFFQALVKCRHLVRLDGFENEDFIFPSVHHSTKFCLLTATGSQGEVDSADFVFFARSVEDTHDHDRRFQLGPGEIERINPNTLTCPVFRSRQDAEIAALMYSWVPVLVRDDVRAKTWDVEILQGLFNMAADSALFQEAGAIQNLDGVVRLFESKMIHQFDHRFGTYSGQTGSQANQGKLPELSEADHLDPTRVATARYCVRQADVDAALGKRWTREWLVGWRAICRNTDSRTVITSLLPRVAVGHTMLVLLPREAASDVLLLIACLNSFCFDYAARQKSVGASLNIFNVKQLPVLPLARFASAAGVDLRSIVRKSALELTYTSWELLPFAQECGVAGPPFRWDDERRFLLRCLLDAASFHLYLASEADGSWRRATQAYGAAHDQSPQEFERLKSSFPTPRDAVSYIMDTFPIVRRGDEAAHGEYRTKRVILEIYDEMAEAIRTGQPYQTRLDPPPADPRVAHPPRQEQQ